MNVSSTTIRALTPYQRAFLIRHIEGPLQRFAEIGNRGADKTSQMQQQTITKLINLGLIRGDRPFRPHYTVLTNAGREAAAAVLGEYAEALISAGCLELDESGLPALRPIDILRRIRLAAIEQKIARPGAAQPGLSPECPKKPDTPAA